MYEVRTYDENKRHVVWIDGGEEWWVDGKLHREDGPAVIRSTGLKQWWFKGKILYQNNEAFTTPLIGVETTYGKKSSRSKDNILHIVDNTLFTQVADTTHYIVVAEDIAGYDEISDRPLKFKKILTDNSFAFIPELPGL